MKTSILKYKKQSYRKIIGTFTWKYSSITKTGFSKKIRIAYRGAGILLFLVLFDSVAYSQITIAENSSRTGAGNLSWIGQSFTSSDTAAFVSFELGYSGSINSGTYELYEGNGTSGTKLASGNLITGSGSGVSVTKKIANFSDVILNQGQMYTFVMKPGTSSFNFGFSNANPYSGGTYFYEDLGSFYQVSNLDLVFKVSGYLEYPEASNVMVTGAGKLDSTLTVTYDYSHTGNLPTGGSAFQWYKANDNQGTNETSISGATDSTIKITTENFDKYFRVSVTPSDGSIDGPTIYSDYFELDPPFDDGSGTEINPYLISKVFQLNFIREYLDSHFQLTGDIDMNVAPYNSGEGWNPIGTNSSGQEFSGTFDGNGFIISNLFIDRSSTNFNGLFGATKNAVLKNIALENVNITGDEYTGALVGINYSEIRNSYSTGSVSGYNHTGGLAGAVETWDGSTGLVTNSYSHANVSGSNYGASSLVGRLKSGTIEYSFGTGSVSASSGNGGLIGEKNSGTVTNSYWDTQTTGQSTSDGGTGLTTAQMQQSSNFAGFDFNDKWSSIDGKEYPYLQTFGYKKTGISGDDGWRMLSAPVSGTSYRTLLDSLWTQGFTGADYTGGTSNVYTWNESNQVFESISNATDEPATGKGFITYVFSDDNGPDATGDAGFPKVLTNSETQFSGTANPAITFTDSGTLADDGWNLLGNPYGTSIDWDAANGWSRTNMDGTFYVWSDSAGGGTGAYLSWNGITGTLNNGKIAPWQGFWVKANATSPSISINDSTRSTGGTLFKKATIPQIKFTLNGDDKSSRAIVMFHEEALEGKDKFDAYKLNSLNRDYLLLGMSLENLELMDIQALPIQGSESLIDLDVKGSNLNGEFELNWDQQSIPGDWEITLIDRKMGAQINISETSSITFDMVSETKAKQIEKLSVPTSPVQVVDKSKKELPRFALRITQNSSVSNEPGIDLPQTVELEQNYPNPFNPSTTIAFGVPENGEVTLEIFDILGRKVATLLNRERKSAGRYTVDFDASSLASGIYLYRLQSGNSVLIKKLTLIK